MTETIRFPEARLRAALPAVIELRRTLHAIPEIGQDLPETAVVVAAALTRLGLVPHRVGDGMWVDIGNHGPLVAIRADMDGLPLTEMTGLPHASRFPGRMHACGHDAHTACLLGAAGLLAGEASQGRLPFRARLVFQTGEEGHYGALPMIAAGVLEGVAAIVAGHVGAMADGQLQPGQAGFLHGPVMAASDRFKGAFIGPGGHASEPHRSPDPVSALAEYILALNSFRARELDTRPTVVSVCSIHGGETFNVIPERVEFKGTARSIDPDVRAKLADRIHGIAQAVAQMRGLELAFQWFEGYPPTVNDARASAVAAGAAQALLGAQRVVVLTRPSMGGEDFSYYLQKVPGCYWILNTQAPVRGLVHPNHSPRFDVDEAHLWALMGVNLAAAERLAVEFG